MSYDSLAPGLPCGSRRLHGVGRSKIKSNQTKQYFKALTAGTQKKAGSVPRQRAYLAQSKETKSRRRTMGTTTDTVAFATALNLGFSRGGRTRFGR